MEEREGAEDDVAGLDPVRADGQKLPDLARTAAFGARPSVLSLERTDFVTTRPAIRRAMPKHLS